MVLLWLIAGLVVVSVAFFLPGNPPEVWPNLNLGGIVTVVYLLALLTYTMREPFGRKAQVTTWIVAIVTVASLAVAWTEMDSLSHYQQQTLLNIRATIGRGIIYTEVPDSLLSVLDRFHHQKGKKATLGQVFQIHYPGTRVGDNIHKANNEYDSLQVYIAALSDTTIALAAQEMYVKGREPTFKNYNGRVGMVQEKFTLTVKGVRHESEN